MLWQIIIIIMGCMIVVVECIKVQTSSRSNTTPSSVVQWGVGGVCRVAGVHMHEQIEFGSRIGGICEGPTGGTKMHDVGMCGRGRRGCVG